MDYSFALLIGIMVTTAIYISLKQIYFAQSTNRTIGLFAGACGLFTTLWLAKNPSILNQYASEIVISALAVALSLLALARRYKG